MKSFEVRKKYIDFFSERGHKEIPSAALLPENDPTSLFTSSGMQPLVPYLLGLKHPLGTRLVDSQKCFRSQDIDEVGDNRHTTFFEMLGNWSLGDYFKKEQLSWIFEFLTRELGLQPKKLFVSVFEGNSSVLKDTDSIEIWKEIFSKNDIDAKEGERIFCYPAKKNWWSRSGEPDKMPPGEPGGPDSEVFFDFGADLKLHERSPFKNETCHPNCDCGRFMEVANSVFMQYQKQQNGSLKELPNKNVDFGGGLERQVAATNHNPDIFRTDVFNGIIDVIRETSRKPYDETFQTPMRIIADHLKAATFMLSEGLVASNKTQGYILRRLIRRAVVKMQTLEIQNLGSTAEQIVLSIIDIYQNVYFHSQTNVKTITDPLIMEIEKFQKTLKDGLKHLHKFDSIDGKIAFDLLSTYGFPWELTVELAKEKGHIVNKVQFETEFKKHQELSRTASKGMFKGGLQDQSEKTTQLHTATHLLQQALRQVLGTHVRQKGSNITAERLRFDFSHPQKVTPEQLTQVEAMVNKVIKENLKVTKVVTSLTDALTQHALTVPGASYPDKVNVYSAGTYSKEVCGGPHVDFTGSLGEFKIIKEEACGSQSRRIYATLTK
jgi:alanyl-tRNA synthetase